jgi:hypothetical protein
MMFRIYAFRLSGDSELRYVGLTSKEAAIRLAALTADAHRRADTTCLREPDAFQCWLIEHEGQIETVEILRVGAKADAHLAERAVAAALIEAGHSLFNTWLVPKDRRANTPGAWKAAA